MLIQAHGKINLSLDITGKREDGYHDIASLMQSVALCDEIELTLNQSGSISVATDCVQLPGGESNIAYRACAAMRKACGLSCGMDVYIRKRIPLAGGMAGGSTDAAAVIRGINALCDLKLSLPEMMEIGVTIGADVPFCIQENAAFATGIGEILKPAVGLPERIWLLLVNPGVEVSTKQIYEAIDRQAAYGTVDNEKLIFALAKEDLDHAKNYMINVMEPVTGTLCPQVPEIVARLKKHGAFHAMMSGSGATCFGLFLEKPDTVAMQALFPGCYVCLTKPYSAE